MNQLNSIILEGNLVRDVEITEPMAGFKVAKGTIGVNRYYKNRNNEDVNEASFFDVDSYGNIAEFFAEKGKKGRGVRVVGRLKQDTWKDSEGKSHSRVFVIAEHIEYKPILNKEEPKAEQTQAEERKTEQKVEMVF